MNSSVFVGVAVVSALIFTGCASGDVSEVSETREPTPRSSATSRPSPSPTEERKDLAVTDFAFGRNSYDATVWWYVAILENPNVDYIFPSTVIDVEAIGADGVLLDTSSDYLTILNGKVAVTGSFFEVGDNEVVDLEVRGPLATAAIRSSSAETGSFAVEGVEAITDSYTTTVGGVLSSTFADEQTSVYVAVIARNAEGRIIAGERTYVERLPVSGKVRFEVTFFDPLPSGTTYEVYPAL